jgi:hypothetical protein
MPRLHRILPLALMLALAWTVAHAQNRVRTQTIRPPETPESKPLPPPAAAQPEIITDLARLPEPVARMRASILAAARSGNIDTVVTVMQQNDTMPVFTLGDQKDPATLWKTGYPDSDGLEVLAILISILEAPYVHADKGTPQEAYIWPYFARTDLKSLTQAQKVELFRIVTGADYKDMLEFGAYSFYRLGIGPDGRWHYFVAGD